MVAKKYQNPSGGLKRRYFKRRDWCKFKST